MDDNESLVALASTLGDSTSNFGLKLLGFTAQAHDPRADNDPVQGDQMVDDKPPSFDEMVRNTDVNVFMVATFQVEPIAWTRRVQAPEELQAEQEFDSLIIEDEAEMQRRAVLSELQEMNFDEEE